MYVNRFGQILIPLTISNTVVSYLCLTYVFVNS
jgi:hypothetical protein